MTRLDIRRAWLLAFGDDVLERKRSGRAQHVTLCPFHDELHPSCDVSLAKNAFICRSCGAHGGTLDAIVLAGYAKSHAEAAKWLQDRGAL